MPLTTTKKNPQLLLVGKGEGKEEGVKNTEWDRVNTARPEEICRMHGPCKGETAAREART